MSERTGLGPLEEAILLTLDDLTHRSDRPYRKSAFLLGEMDRNLGFGPRYVYEPLCDLARPWVVLLPLIDGHGNFGSPDYSAADSLYTECRLSPAGKLAVAAERGQIPPLPIGLINGTHYRGGTQPSFNATGVIAGLIRLSEDPMVSDDVLLDVVGPPTFPTGCRVDGEIERLMNGQSATLRLSAILTTAEGPHGPALDISNLPPEVKPRQVIERIGSRIINALGGRADDLSAITRLALRHVEDLSMAGAMKIRCHVATGADLDVVRQRLWDIWGLTTGGKAELPAPLPVLLRSWHRQHVVGDETTQALSRLEATL